MHVVGRCRGASRIPRWCCKFVVRCMPATAPLHLEAAPAARKTPNRVLHGTTIDLKSWFREKNCVAWMLLLLAGLFEVVWAVGLKYSQGFTRLWPSVATVIAMLISMVLLAMAMRTLPMGTAYSVWVGIGAVGTVIFGIALWDEPVNAARMISVAFIIIGVIGLKFATPD